MDSSLVARQYDSRESVGINKYISDRAVWYINLMNIIKRKRAHWTALHVETYCWYRRAYTIMVRPLQCMAEKNDSRNWGHELSVYPSTEIDVHRSNFSFWFALAGCQSGRTRREKAFSILIAATTANSGVGQILVTQRNIAKQIVR